MTSYDEEMPMDVTYEFTIKGKTSPDYQCCVSIIEWIKTNLESLTDDNNHNGTGKAIRNYYEF